MKPLHAIAFRHLSKQSELRAELLPHQQRVVDRLRQQPGLVVAHGLGAGKTLSSIAAGDDYGGPVAVTAPASLLPNYEKELERFTDAEGRKRFSLHSVQGVGRSGKGPKGGMLVVDEAHRLRNPSSKSFKALRDREPPYDKRVLLTATPVYNRPHDLAALVNLAAGENVLPLDQREFEKRYQKQEQIRPSLVASLRFGTEPGEVQRLARKRELGTILKRWVDYHENASDHFPARTDEVIEVPMTEAQQQVYDVLMEKAPKSIQAKIREGLPPSKRESGDLNAFLSGIRQVSNTTAPYVPPEQEPEVPKLKEAVRRLQERLKENPRHRAVVYSNYLDAGLTPYQRLLQQAGIEAQTFTGGMKARERKKVVDAYNSGDKPVLLVSSAGGEGLDLKGTRQIQILDPHWNEEKLKQVIGRGIRYKSHDHLPPEERSVHVERYLATLPPRKGLKRLLLGKDPGEAVDQYLMMLAEEKDQLNEQVRELLRRT